MATIADIRQRVFDYLYGVHPTDKPYETTLGGSYLDNATSITVANGNDWEAGDVLENALNGDMYLVASVAADVLTVQDDYGGTTSAASVGTDDMVRKNPRFSTKQVDDAIKEALNSMESWGIHNFGTGSITLAAGQYYFELSDGDISEVYGVLGCYYPATNGEQPEFLPFRYNIQLSTSPAEWSTAYGVTLLSKGDRAATGTVYYTYAQSYEFDTDLSTTVAKLMAQHEEMVVVGATARVLGHGILPSTQDPGAFTDRTVQPGQLTRDGRWFQGDFFIKARAEAARLAVLRQRVTAGANARVKRASRWRA